MSAPSAVAPSERTSTFAALARPQFRIYWLAMMLSHTGNWMQMYGQGYLVVQLAIRDGVPSFAPLYLGLVGLSRAVPSVALGLFGGAAADRIDRRRMLLVTQCSAGAVAVVLTALTVSGVVTVAHILALSVASAMIFAFDSPARQSSVPRLVEPPHLSSAVGLIAVGFNGSVMLGPVIGGLLYVPLGIGGLFGITALGFFASTGLLLLIPPLPAGKGSREVGMLRAIRDGLVHVARDPLLLPVFLLALAAALLTRPYLQLLPAIADRVLGVGAVELSWMFGVSGLGAVAGAFITASAGGSRRRGLILLWAYLLAGLFLAVFALQRSLEVALVLLALAGTASMVCQGMTNTLLQLHAPDALRGRVMSVHTLVVLGAIPSGSLLLGGLGSLVGVEHTILGGAALMAAIAAFALLRVRAVRAAG